MDKYDFYEEYIGQKCDYHLYKTRVKNGHPFEIAIMPVSLHSFRKKKPLDQEQRDLKELRERLKEMKKELFETDEYRNLKKEIANKASLIRQREKKKKEK